MRDKKGRGLSGAKGLTMSVRELLVAMPDAGRNQVYGMVSAGVFPVIRVGRKIHLLRVPTMRILRGQLAAGAQPARSIARRARRGRRTGRGAA